MMIGVSAGRPAPARINSLSRLWWWPSIARGGADDDCPPPWTDCLLCYGTVFSTEKRHTDISTRNNHGVVHVCCSNSFLHSVYHGVRAAVIGLNFFSLSLLPTSFLGRTRTMGPAFAFASREKGRKTTGIRPASVNNSSAGCVGRGQISAMLQRDGRSPPFAILHRTSTTLLVSSVRDTGACHDRISPGRGGHLSASGEVREPGWLPRPRAPERYGPGGRDASGRQVPGPGAGAQTRTA
jgi:hypothetical protein